MDKRFEMRAKGLNTGNWYCGTYFEERPFMLGAFSSEKEEERFEKETKHYIIFQQQNDWSLPYDNVQVTIDPNTLGQCTGYLVKTLKEHKEYLYEGDIVTIEGREGEYEFIWDYDLARFALIKGNTDFQALIIELTDLITKIGDKYDLAQRSR